MVNHPPSECTGDPPLSVLVVDDEQPIRFAVERYFTAVGFRVDEAAGLEEAEALLTMNQYSIVIADLRLNGMNGKEGLELISFVRTHTPATRFVLLTAFGSTEIEREAYKRGADRFLSKPQPLAELHRIIYSVLEGGERQKSSFHGNL
jgi:DNA-binding NtrC family response regulator